MLSNDVKKELVEQSKIVRQNAYAPYSQFKVKKKSKNNFKINRLEQLF